MHGGLFTQPRSYSGTSWKVISPNFALTEFSAVRQEGCIRLRPKALSLSVERVVTPAGRWAGQERRIEWQTTRAMRPWAAPRNLRWWRAWMIAPATPPL